jgi:hypothetical protein
MEFSPEEWETIQAALGPLSPAVAGVDGRPPTLTAIAAGILVAALRKLLADEPCRALALLSGGLGTPEAINQLIERIEREGAP